MGRYYEVELETTVTIEGSAYTVKVQYQHYSDRPRSGRAYIWGLDDPADVTAPKYHTLRCDRKKDEGHHKPSCGSCVIDAEWDAYNHAIVRDQRAVLNAINEALALGLTKMRFSRYAGCTCPCSPGFRVDGAFGKDIFITKKA